MTYQAGIEGETVEDIGAADATFHRRTCLLSQWSPN